MTAIGLLIVGVVVLIVGYYAPLPPLGKIITNIIGWACVAVAAILILASLLGLSTGLSLR